MAAHAEVFSAQMLHYRHLQEAAPKLASALQPFDRLETVSLVSGLLLAPECRPAIPRIEALIHAAVVNCTGSRTPQRDHLIGWFNRHVDRSEIKRVEDPAEDLLIAQVWNRDGNFRFVGGLWEAAEHRIQCALDIVDTFPDEGPLKLVRMAIVGLLRLSTDAITHAAIPPLETGAPGYASQVPVPEHDILKAHASYLRFSKPELIGLGIEPTALEPFVLNPSRYAALVDQHMRDSELCRRPLLRQGDSFLLALPSAVPFAIREFLADSVDQAGLHGPFADALRERELAALLLEGMQRLGGSQLPVELHPKGNPSLPMDLFLMRYDEGSYCILWFLRDPRFRAGVADESTKSIPELAADMRAQLNVAIQAIEALPDFIRGLVLVVTGGFSGGVHMGVPILAKPWVLQSYGLHDLLVIARTQRAHLRTLWRMGQLETEYLERNARFVNANGDFNLYAWWVASDYRILPKDVTWDQRRLLYQIPINGMLRLRAADRHEQSFHAAFRRDLPFPIVVRRDAPHPLFEADRDKNLFVAFHVMGQGRLWGVAETATRAWWIIVDEPGNSPVERDAAYQIWHCFCEWTDRIALRLEPVIITFAGPLELRVKFEGLETWQDTQSATHIVETSPELKVEVDPTKRAASLTITKEFFESFRQPTNRAERTLIRGITEAALSIAGLPADPGLVHRVETELASDPQARFFHTYLTNDPAFAGVDVTGHKTPLLHEGVISFMRPGTAPFSQKKRVIVDRAEAKQEIFAAVSRLKQKMVADLAQLNRASVIIRVLRSIEAVKIDSNLWRVTAASLRAINGDEELKRTAGEKENLHNIQKVASRSILEAALFSCPADGGRKIGELEFEELLARQAVLLELGIFGEELKSPLPIDELIVYPNGEIECGGVLRNQIVHAFNHTVFQERLDWAASTYGELFERRPNAEKDPWLTRLDAGISAEFGLASLSDVADAIYALAKEADQNKVSIWIETESALAARLSTVLNLPLEKTRQFVRRAQLYPWNLLEGEAPLGFKPRDVAPWHFRRRFSLLARPLIALETGDDRRVVVCPAQMNESFDHLFHQISRGCFHHEFFESDTMRAVVRERAQSLADNFETNVAECFRDQGYTVKKNLMMTTLGAPAALGEIDVLAWDNKGTVWVVESKLLRSVYSAADIVHQFSDFEGKPGDRLGQHLGRIGWIDDNPSGLSAVIGNAVRGSVNALIVTSNLVPIQFLDDGRFKRTAVLNIDRLATRLSSIAAASGDGANSAVARSRA